jgi:hypothetical protein
MNKKTTITMKIQQLQYLIGSDQLIEQNLSHNVTVARFYHNKAA